MCFCPPQAASPEGALAFLCPRTHPCSSAPLARPACSLPSWRLPGCLERERERRREGKVYFTGPVMSWLCPQVPAEGRTDSSVLRPLTPHRGGTLACARTHGPWASSTGCSPVSPGFSGSQTFSVYCPPNLLDHITFMTTTMMMKMISFRVLRGTPWQTRPMAAPQETRGSYTLTSSGHPGPAHLRLASSRSPLAQSSLFLVVVGLPGGN